MSEYSVVLPGGGGEVTITPGGGQYYRILAGTGVIDVSVNGRVPTARAQGEQQHVPEGIASLRISAQTAQTVDVAVTAGGLDDGRVTQTAPVKSAQGSVVTDGAPVAILAAATLIMAAVAVGGYRYGLRFWNQGSADVMVGGAGVSLTSGVKIPPGSIWVEETGANAAWYAITAAAGTNSVSVQVLS